MADVAVAKHSTASNSIFFIFIVVFFVFIVNTIFLNSFLLMIAFGES